MIGHRFLDIRDARTSILHQRLDPRLRPPLARLKFDVAEIGVFDDVRDKLADRR